MSISIWWTDPRHGLKKEQLAALEMNGKPAPLYRSSFKHLEWVRIALRTDSRSCYINPSSSPPPPPALFQFPQQLQGSALFSLLAVGNHLHPCMENFLRLETRRGGQRAARMHSAPSGSARYDMRTRAIAAQWSCYWKRGAALFILRIIKAIPYFPVGLCFFG